MRHRSLVTMLAVLASFVLASDAAMCGVPRDLEIAIWAFPFLRASRVSLFNCSFRCHQRRRKRRRRRRKRSRISTGGKGGGVGLSLADRAGLAFVPRMN